MTTISETPRNFAAQPAALQELAQRLQEWRSKRVRRQRIPEEFWQAAIALVSEPGLNPTAAALQLNYYDLQRRVSGSGGRPPKRRQLPPGFIELAPPAPPPGSVEPSSTLEWVQPSGARLSLRLPRATSRDLLPLVELLLRQGL